MNLDEQIRNARERLEEENFEEDPSYYNAIDWIIEALETISEQLDDLKK